MNSTYDVFRSAAFFSLPTSFYYIRDYKKPIQNRPLYTACYIAHWTLLQEILCRSTNQFLLSSKALLESKKEYIQIISSPDIFSSSIITQFFLFIFYPTPLEEKNNDLLKHKILNYSAQKFVAIGLCCLYIYVHVGNLRSRHINRIHYTTQLSAGIAHGLLGAYVSRKSESQASG